MNLIDLEKRTKRKEKRPLTFLFSFFFFLFSQNISAQSPVALQYHPDLLGWQVQVPRSAGFYSFNTAYWQENLKHTPPPTLSELKWQELEFDVHDLPVFCRMEVQMEKVIRIPIKFRLGEVQYVEKMEGKY